MKIKQINKIYGSGGILSKWHVSIRKKSKPKKTKPSAAKMRKMAKNEKICKRQAPRLEPMTLAF